MSTVKRDILAKQSELNGSTRGQWQSYASHRAQIERLLVREIGPESRRLCVLGAGNCNDLDLTWLGQVFSEVHLVDIDAAALEKAARRQGVAGLPHLHRHAPIDLLGIGSWIARWANAEPSDGDIRSCAREIIAQPTPLLGGPFDVVLSPCVLTQLILPVRDALGVEHPGFGELRSAIRLRHLRLLAELLAPGGAAILATDLVSSDAFADLPHVPSEELPDLMAKLIPRRKSFTGLDPASLRQVVRSDSSLAQDITSAETCAPWLWHLGLRRTYLVYAMRFQKRRAALGHPLRRQSIFSTNRSPADG